ncbi:MAG: OB-fold nucleic acid binding domain-containing protein [Thermoflexales bacterium]|nr:OB-fold nucleic acid binding domain-containing protein [Thermoflexales bacterium]
MRLLKLLSLFLALSSVAALIVATRALPAPTSAADAMRPALHYAYVRVQGAVVGFPITQEGQLAFWLFDGSGSVQVVLPRSASTVLSQAGLPLPGDQVTAEGSLRVRADRPVLLVSSPSALRVETPPATPLTLSELARASGGARVKVTGQVRRVRWQEDGHTVVTLRAGEATAEIVLSAGIAALPVGVWVAARGGVDDRGTARRVLVSRTEDITQVEPRPPTPVAIRTLSRRALGRWVAVQGQVFDLRPFDAGMRVIVQDASVGTIAVVIPDPLWYTLPFSNTVVIGDSIWAQGELSERRSQLELLPELPEDMRVEPPN